MLNFSKRFGDVRVLEDVSLNVAGGEIHGLVGQNGSGKSTLIKLLSGVHRPDKGARLLIDEHEAPLPVTPRFLLQHGLSFVHQHLGLELTGTVVENVRVGRFQPRRVTRRIDWRTEAASVAKTLARLEQPHIEPFQVVGDLNHTDRTTVAIARALQSIEPGRGCIVFDETTQSLPRSVLENFYTQVRALAATGTSVVIVSHRIPEILSLCDRVTVLDGGFQTAAGVPVPSLDAGSLTALITGHTRPHSTGRERPERDRSGAAISLHVTGLSGDIVHDLDLTVRRGEIVGITGGPDSGSDEVPALLAGVRTHTTGTLTTIASQHDLAKTSPRRLSASGIAYVPSDRTGEGIAVSLTAADNISLPRFGRRGRPWFLGRRWIVDEFDQSTRLLGITPANRELPAAAFSGGNQQKLLLSKWLLNKPDVILLHEPVQAVDVGAREDLLSAVLNAAENGSAIVISSIEADDLARLCDRVLVLRHGRLHAELRGDDITPTAIVTAVYDRTLQEQLP